MAIPAPSTDPDEQRRPFTRLRDALESLRARLPEAPLDTLSMGMSSDLEAAVMEGATLVRLAPPSSARASAPERYMPAGSPSGHHRHLHRTDRMASQVTFIGAGNMAGAIIGGMIDSGYSADAITATSPDDSALAPLRERLGIHTETDNASAVLRPTWWSWRSSHRSCRTSAPACAMPFKPASH